MARSYRLNCGFIGLVLIDMIFGLWWMVMEGPGISRLVDASRAPGAVGSSRYKQRCSGTDFKKG